MTQEELLHLCYRIVKYLNNTELMWMKLDDAEIAKEATTLVMLIRRDKERGSIVEVKQYIDLLKNERSVLQQETFNEYRDEVISSWIELLEQEILNS